MSYPTDEDEERLTKKQRREEARAARKGLEEDERSRDVRRQRLKLIGGPLGALAVVAVVVLIATNSGGSGAGTGAPITPAASGVRLPAPKISSLTEAVKAAGCETSDTAVAISEQGRTHVEAGTKVNYKTNPPAYGPHYPSPASDGEYKPGQTPAVGYVVHAMEHGRVEYQYRAGLPQPDVKDLEALFNETDGSWAGGQLLLLFQNTTGMPYDVAATAWGHVLGCKRFNTGVFDALRDFRVAYTNQGPERTGTGPE